MNHTLYKGAFWFDLMLVLLACVAGSVDVMSYYRLGHVFTANMTGNTILLGLAIGQGKVASSLHSLAALAGFFAGSITGALFIYNTKKTWTFFISLSTFIEALIIFVLALIWFEQPVITNETVLYVSIILSAIAMGIQSVTVRHLNIPGIVTTYLTGTITSIGMSVVTGIKRGFRQKAKEKKRELPLPKNLEQRIKLQVLVYVAYGLTAVFTGWLEYLKSFLLPMLPLLLILIVLIIVLSRPKHPHLSTLQHTSVAS
ncbi:MAG: YoaK family protein [Ginsengibacter sp.]|nr:YoaK family protein [Hanamia sp.]